MGKEEGAGDVKLALIEWEDSCGVGSAWVDVHEDDLPTDPMICVSVGWMIERENVFVVIPHFGLGRKDLNTETQGCGDMTIPKSAVKKIHELGEYSDAFYSA